MGWDACLKKAYPIFEERKYRTRLLGAAYRHHMHWTELIGGDVVLTIPYEWQVKFNNSDYEVKERFDQPVPSRDCGHTFIKVPRFPAWI